MRCSDEHHFPPWFYCGGFVLPNASIWKKGEVALSLSEKGSSSRSFIENTLLNGFDLYRSREIDEALMSKPGFSIDQLMELAGLSVAKAAHVFAQEYCSTDEAKQQDISCVRAWK